jgi:hypothetical protein
VKWRVEFQCRSWKDHGETGTVIETIDAPTSEAALDAVRRKYNDRTYRGFSVEPHVLTEQEYLDALDGAGPPMG